MNYMITLLWLILFSIQHPPLEQAQPPNVIIIMTDDQGIGDLSCHGNPWLKTPHLDAFYEKAIRLTDFHVSPVCTPTRSALMTGQYPINNGAWATYKGRDALGENTTTVADLFKANGYRTGIFGKWHLGDNYPVRPTDCGFDVAIHHKAGGVGELSDHWGNSYFDDIYYVNNQPKRFQGYCTDVWFAETIKFIEDTPNDPFFIYLPTNAPHDPHYVNNKYAAPYQALEGKEIVSANFFGMIANIDENFGKLERYLTAKGLIDNTILIFLTDNGSSSGVNTDGSLGYNKGLRGKKGSKAEGGHRVPFFIHWPDGNLLGGKDINDLSGHVDLLPTLTSLCKLQVPQHLELDGMDLSPLLFQEIDSLPQRTLFVHHRQDWRPPMDNHQTCLMMNQWRLLNGKELYQINKDRLQQDDLSKKFPEIVAGLLTMNDQFLKKSKARTAYNEFPVNVIGHPDQKVITLTIQHAIGEDKGIWKAHQVAAGLKNSNNTHAIKVERDGIYLISCQRWPKECPGPILGVPKENPKEGMYQYQSISPSKVSIQIANQIHEKTIAPQDVAVKFRVKLEKGKSFLINDFIEKGEKYGVYYTYIEYLGPNTL